MSVKKTIGGHHMIVLGYLILEPGNCLEYHIFNFLDGKNWRNEMRVVYNKPKHKTILPRPAVYATLFFNKKEMREIRKQFLIEEEYNNPEKTVRFVGGTDESGQ